MSFGDWSLELSEQTPQAILDVLTSETSGFLGHVMVTPTAVDIREVNPQSIARYTGVYRSRDFTSVPLDAGERRSRVRRTIQGSSLLYWLGDQDSRGPINETVQNLNAVSFTTAVNAVLPPAITAGNIIAEIGTQTLSFLLRTARYRLERVCAAWNAEYEVTPQGTLNAGTPASLYPTFNAPTCFIKRGPSGSDPLFKGFPVAEASLGADAIDFATRKLLVASVDEVPTIKGQANQATSKRDLHGNLVAITDLSTESDSNGANPDTRAAALLAQLTATRNNVRLSTARYDVDGTLKVGDSIYVWDVEAGLYDMANEVRWRGETYWPAKLRVFGLRWPLTLNEDGSKPGVYFREPTMAGTLWDLTPYVVFEGSGSTEVTVGALARSLIPESTEPLGPIVAAVTSPDDTPPPAPSAPSVAGNVLNVQVVVDLAGMPLDLHHISVYISTTSGFTPGPLSYVGDISATKSHVEPGVFPVATFPVPTTATRYVRITAVDIAGNESPASSEVPVVATLIDTVNITNAAITDAKIGSVSAGKLVAGDVSAAIITLTASGKFRFGRTSAPFHHGYVDASGIHTFRDGSAAYTGGTPAFEHDIATDTLRMLGGTITGSQIQSATSGKRVVMGPVGFETHSFQAYGAEGNPAIYFGVVVGTGGTRYVQTTLQGAHPDVPSTRTASLTLQSTSWDLTRKTLARLMGEEILLLQSPGSSYVEVKSNIVVNASGTLALDFNSGIVAMNGAAIDLFHDSGGRIFIDDQIELITDGTVRAYIDNVPGGGTGDTSLRVQVLNIGQRRLIADVVDSGGAGFRRLVVAN